MKRSVSMFLMLLCFILVFITACSNSNNESESKKDVKLVFWNSNFKSIDENDKTKVKKDFYIYQAVERFEKENPGITVEIQNEPGGPEAFTKFKTASIAKNGPDINTIWSGSYLYAMKQYIEPLDSYLENDPILDELIGWDAVNELGEGSIWGIPAGNDGITALFYNKELIQKAGLDYENQPPKDAREWIASLEKIKASGIETPLALEDYSFWFYTAYWLQQSIGIDNVNDLFDGTLKFSDPKIIDILTTNSELGQKKLVSYEQPSERVTQGKAAMVIGGSWLIPDLKKNLGDKFGMIKIPDYNSSVVSSGTGLGGVGSAYFVTNYSKHKAEAVEFLKFLTSKEEQEYLLKSGESSLVTSKVADYDSIITDPEFIKMQQWSTSDGVFPYMDNSINADIANEISKLAPTIVSGQMSPKDFADAIDKKAEEVLGN